MMSFRQAEYSEIRDCMHPGDVIAFSGVKFVSGVIKAVTRGNVSHVGVIVPPEFLDESCNEPVIGEVNEQGLIFSRLSDKVNDDDIEVLWWLPLCLRPDEKCFKSAVEKHRETKYDYPQAMMLVLECFEPVFASAGQQLHASIRQILLDAIVPSLRERILDVVPGISESESLDSYLRRILSPVIDEHLDVTSLADLLVDLIGNREDPNKLFCSEFIANVLESSKVICQINESRTTPIELCLLEGIYAKYIQFKGCRSQPISRREPPNRS